jgi:hypothetical protein
LIGDIKLCHVTISCQNLAIINQESKNQTNSPLTSKSMAHLTHIIDNLNDRNAMSGVLEVKSSDARATNWFSDRDLGAGVLNRFGASIVSLILHLFDNNKVCFQLFNTKKLVKN